MVTTAAAARPRRTGTEAAAPAAAGTTAAAAGTCSSPNAPPPHEHERKSLGSTAMAGQHQARLARGPRAEAAAEAVAASPVQGGSTWKMQGNSDSDDSDSDEAAALAATPAAALASELSSRVIDGSTRDSDVLPVLGTTEHDR